jgi:hypothetical protein
MSKNTKQTSTRIGRLASETLQSNGSSKGAKSLAASALAQRSGDKQTGAKMEDEDVAARVLASDRYASSVNSARRALMSQDLSDSQLKAIWRRGQVPVIFKRSKPLPVLARIPFAEGNMEWLRDDRRSKPKWSVEFKAWEYRPRGSTVSSSYR